jgi:hypothetical protein
MDPFDFKRAGYESPGDRDRTMKLLSRHLDGSTLWSWLRDGSTKAAAVELLGLIGVELPPFDAEAARTRNERKEES